MTDWRRWLRGLIATVVNGLASGVVLIVADPADFNIFDGRERLITVSLLMGLLGAANYLRENPLPEWDGVDRRKDDAA